MKRKFFYFLTFAAALALASCSNNGDKGKDGADSTKTEGSASNDGPSKGKYPVKSGIITYNVETMGMTVPTTLYFDDYGNKECTEVTMEMEMMGQKVQTHNMTITKDGYTYDLNLTEKTGKKMKAMPAASNTGGVDFSQLSDAMMKEMHITKGGNENVCGKDCQVFTMDNPDTKMKATFAVWNNIPLKSNMDMGGMAAVMNAIQVEENVTIPADKFEVPSDITVTEM